MSAIIAVSEIEKKAEQHNSSTTAPICAQSGQESKAGEERRRSAHYNRGVCRFCAGGHGSHGQRNIPPDRADDAENAWELLCGDAENRAAGMT
ncbi:hypothetical protein [Ralstonia psammae]|uniref:hypothetical protein n=1 Tax=Ralstonia psammae TaxID=3058598 RepID=UPI00292D0E01|nr:hypothetical protein [Ralstonia sp. LMG 19083]